MSAPVPADPLDRVVLAVLRDLGGDDGFFVELIDTFLAGADEQMQRLRAAVATGDAAGVRAAAHAIKGSASNLGARDVAAVARALEQAAGSGAADGLGAQIEGLAAALSLASSALLEESRRAGGD